MRLIDRGYYLDHRLDALRYIVGWLRRSSRVGMR